MPSRAPESQPSADTRSRPSAENTLLSLDENCCAITHAGRFSMLVDGAAYFDAFRRAAELAQRSILILAWDFDSRTPVKWDATGVTLRVGPFLNSLVERRRRLQIYVLDWDYPMIYGLEREPPPIYGLGWKAHRRVHIRYDNSHPLVASQHQKIVVIDDPRRDWQGKRYPPFHDVMALVDEEPARELAVIARARWQRATGERLEPVQVETDPWPAGLRPDLEGVQVGIACTEPESDSEPGSRAVERLYLDMIARARRYIYIENQYFTARRIGEALAARLAEPNGPEIIVVTRLLSHGWLEEVTMHRLRARLVNELRAADRHGRFHALYPHVPGLAEGTCVDLHSKVMIVDDEWLRIGSANVSNRSMGLDTECDVMVDAQGREATTAAIRAARDRLVGEHLNVAPSEVSAAIQRSGSLAGAIAALASDGRTLKALEPQPELSEEVEDVVAAAADPERPVSLDALLEQFSPDMEVPRSRFPWRLLALAGAVVAVVVAYWLSPFGELAEAEKAARLVREAAGHWWLAPLIVLAYTPGSFVLFPRSVITVSAAIAFGPALAFLYATSGCLVAASVGYAGGRRFPRDVVRRVAGTRLNRLSELLRGQGLLTLSAIRLVPLGPFAVQNVVAGAVGVPLPRFLAATFIGILPGTLVTTVFGDQLRLILLEGGKLDYWLVASLALWLGISVLGARFILSRRRLRRLKAAGRPSVEESTK